MPRSPGFKPCTKSMPLSDLHASCLKCLGEAHVQGYYNCRDFSPCTKKNREARLKFLLMEEALRPSSEPSQSDSALSISASVQSAPSTMRDSRYRSLSPVPRKKHKKQLAKRGHSPAQKKAKHGERSGVLPESGHCLASSPCVVPLILSCLQALLSPVPDKPVPEGQQGSGVIAVLATLEAFMAGRYLLVLLVLPLMAVQEPV